MQSVVQNIQRAESKIRQLIAGFAFGCLKKTATYVDQAAEIWIERICVKPRWRKRELGMEVSCGLVTT